MLAGLAGYSGFRRNASKARKADLRAKQGAGRRSLRVAAEVEWDKLSSDDIETWMDNGSPPTPLLVSCCLGANESYS